MTFYEAALQVLEEAKRPLTHHEITHFSLEKGLLSHVGKTPEITMLSRLAAMAKRPRDRKVIVTAKDTFALSDWMLPEDPIALENTGVADPSEEEAMPPLRSQERHPEARQEYVRTIGRQADRERKRRDDEHKRRRYPPGSEVTFEILSEAQSGLTPAEVLERGRKRDVVSADFTVDQMLYALLEDNQRRIDAGRRPQFVYTSVPNEPAVLSLDNGSNANPQEVQLQFAAAAGVPVENGRPVLRRPEKDSATTSTASGEEGAAFQTVRQNAKDARRAIARVLKKKMGELDAGTFEKVVVKMLHKLSFREVKVARRSKEGPLLTARLRDGSLEIRYAIRLLKGHGAVERRQVQELRRDLPHHGAHLGIIISAGDARNETRSEALSGTAIFLWCGDGLADQILDTHTAVKVHVVEVFEIDEAFFETARKDAEEARQRRDEMKAQRANDRSRSGESQKASSHAPARPSSDGGAAPFDESSEGVSVTEAASTQSQSAEEADGDEADESPSGESGASAQAGEGGSSSRRRRRRRRGRRSRGAGGPEGAQGQPGAPAGSAPHETREAAPAADAPVPPAPAPTPASEPTSGNE